MCDNCKEQLQSSLQKERGFASKGCLKKIACNIDGCFNISNYQFLSEENSSEKTVHPNLWEQAQLNMNYGLYRVTRADEIKKELEDGHPCNDILPGDVFHVEPRCVICWHGRDSSTRPSLLFQK